MSANQQPVCHVVAGPNGSGKSTFALVYLPDYARLADKLMVFDAARLTQDLLFTRNGTEVVYNPGRTAQMREELGI